MARWAWLLILLTAGCAQLPEKPCPVCPPPKPAPERAQYIETSFASVPGWDSTNLEPSLRAFMAGCPRASGAMINACAIGSTIAIGDEAGARRFFETTFTPFALVSTESGDTGLATGYYEPILRGSRTRSELNRFPIFGVPDDLVVVDLAAVAPEVRNLRLRGRVEGKRVVPYYSRAEIESRGESFRAPVIGWTADPVELFFLQIQGSGQLELESGERIRLGYAEQNGHPYRSLGRYLVERGELKLEEASMQGIKSWGAANPAKLQDALNVNASYVFFRESADPRGPIGALGVPRSPLARISVGVLFTPRPRPSSRFFSTGVEQLAFAVGGLLRSATSSQALARSGEHQTCLDCSASSGRITGNMKT